MGATKARQLRRAQELAAKQGLPPPASLAELTTAPSSSAAAATAEAAATAAPTAAGEVRQKKRKHKDVQVDGTATVPAGGASTASGTFSTASGTFSGSLSKKDRSDTLKAQDLQDLKAQSWKKPSAGHSSASQVQMAALSASGPSRAPQASVKWAHESGQNSPRTAAQVSITMESADD